MISCFFYFVQADAVLHGLTRDTRTDTVKYNTLLRRHGWRAGYNTHKCGQQSHAVAVAHFQKTKRQPKTAEIKFQTTEL